MSVKIKKEIREFEILLRSVPSPIIALFAISVIVMNLLANKSLELPFDWLALDCGIIVSWSLFCQWISSQSISAQKHQRKYRFLP